jgi:hypothetical protein
VLSTEMTKIGYDVSRETAGNSDNADLQSIEARLHPAEVARSLIVEGRKP